MGPERIAASNARVKKTIEEMPLNRIREARNLTQEHLASILHKDQSAISQLERRTDMYVRTLADFIKALGGELEIRARAAATSSRAKPGHIRDLAGGGLFPRGTREGTNDLPDRVSDYYRLCNRQERSHNCDRRAVTPPTPRGWPRDWLYLCGAPAWTRRRTRVNSFTSSSQSLFLPIFSNSAAMKSMNSCLETLPFLSRSIRSSICLA